jgi:hypothetical protein
MCSDAVLERQNPGLSRNVDNTAPGESQMTPSMHSTHSPIGLEKGVSYSNMGHVIRIWVGEIVPPSTDADKLQLPARFTGGTAQSTLYKP